MGPQLSKINLKIIESTKADDVRLNSDTIVSSNGKEDINLFVTIKNVTDTRTNPILSDNGHQVLNSENKLIKQIQNNLSLLINTTEQTTINSEIDRILMKDILEFVTNHYQRAMKDIQDIPKTQQKLQEALKEKLEIDKNVDRSVFAEPYTASCAEKNKQGVFATITGEKQKTEFQFQKLSFFGLQTLISILLILIRSAEKNDSRIVDQILTQANELCEQIPMKCLSSSVLSRATNNLLCKSLKPLTNYMHELYLSEDPIVAKHAVKILLSISIAKASLKDILTILSKLVSNKDDVYDVRGLLLQMNDGLIETINEREKRMRQTFNGKASASKSDSDSSEDESEDDNDHENENENENEDENENENEDEDDDSYYEREHLNNTTLNETAASVDSSTTPTNESTIVFDDRLERTLNSRGRYARLGSTGKFYCGGTLDGSQCNCCNGKCGPTNGCNCSSCMLLDVQKRVLPRGWLVNSDGASARCSRQNRTTYYCGRRVMPDDGTSDGYCGPTNGPQCTACQRLNQQRHRRYSRIWTIRSNSSATSTNESTTVFDDRLERTLNSRGRYARLGSTGKFYCGGTLDGSQCNCCNGKCGPTNGCNCSSCMLLDVQKRVLPRGWLVNSDGAPARCSSQLPTTFYCGRRVMPDDGTSDGYCGPTNGPQCTACQRLNQQQRDRYKHIWIG
ncbi:unnamed protein product [Rotaria sp. Silwood1]|nr:unnamed protein product [Rotaria sp. Silwood1]